MQRKQKMFGTYLPDFTYPKHQSTTEIQTRHFHTTITGSQEVKGSPKTSQMLETGPLDRAMAFSQALLEIPNMHYSTLPKPYVVNLIISSKGKQQTKQTPATQLVEEELKVCVLLYYRASIIILWAARSQSRAAFFCF